MTNNSLDSQRQQLVARLKSIREDYKKCVSDVSTEVANHGSEWSIIDLLRHVAGGYGGMLTRLLEDDNPDLGGAFDADANWKRITDTTLRNIDEAIQSANELTIEQLGRSGQRSGKSIIVLDVLGLMADHYDEHLTQLKVEIRPREDLPRT